MFLIVFPVLIRMDLLDCSVGQGPKNDPVFRDDRIPLSCLYHKYEATAATTLQYNKNRHMG